MTVYINNLVVLQLSTFFMFVIYTYTLIIYMTVYINNLILLQLSTFLLKSSIYYDHLTTNGVYMFLPEFEKAT